MRGDRVLYHGEPGEIEFVADGTDAETDWFVTTMGIGCMVTAKSCGSTYIRPASFDWEDVEFVSRARSE